MSAIKVYENGYAVGGEGHTSDADDITFDNTGTDLVSEDVESAIKEVNERTKHGIVELWKNSNIGANFAGQTVTINDYDSSKYDAVVIVREVNANESYGSDWVEFDNDSFGTMRYLDHTMIATDRDELYRRWRPVTINLSSNVLSVLFGDNTLVKNTAGSITSSTQNSTNIPVRILGLIHNS